jgi:hypothetical protein
MSKENISKKKLLNPIRTTILNYSSCFRGCYYYYNDNNKSYRRQNVGIDYKLYRAGLRICLKKIKA